MKKRYNSVDEMLRDICSDDPEFLKEWFRPRMRFSRWVRHWKIYFAVKWSKLTGKDLIL